LHTLSGNGLIGGNVEAKLGKIEKFTEAICDLS
jgi:hypothetical protein